MIAVMISMMCFIVCALGSFVQQVALRLVDSCLIPNNTKSNNHLEMIGNSCDAYPPQTILWCHPYPGILLDISVCESSVDYNIYWGQCQPICVWCGVVWCVCGLNTTVGSMQCSGMIQSPSQRPASHWTQCEPCHTQRHYVPMFSRCTVISNLSVSGSYNNYNIYGGQCQPFRKW